MSAIWSVATDQSEGANNAVVPLTAEQDRVTTLSLPAQQGGDRLDEQLAS